MQLYDASLDIGHGASFSTAPPSSSRVSKPPSPPEVQRKSALSCTRGAVMVEFLIAFLPLFTFFECLLQLSALTTAKLVVNHAAICAARAASVVIHDHPDYYEGQAAGKVDGLRRKDVELAAAIPMRALSSLVDLKITFPSTAGGTDDRLQFEPHELIRVRLEGLYVCRIPLASRLVCNFLTQTRTIVAEAALPAQGAQYPYGASERTASSE